MNNQLVFAFDGDNIGKRHAKAILSDDLNQVKEISSHITQANEYIKQFVESNGGEWISGGGDEGSFTVSSDFINSLNELRSGYYQMVQATLSIGYGDTISQAGKALLAAKARGKNQVVGYDESVEQDIENEKSKAGSDESEEQKKIKAVLDSDEDESKSEESSAVNDGLSDEQAHLNEDVASDKVLPSGSDSAQNESTLCEPHQEDNNFGYDSGYKNDDQTDREESYQRNDLSPPVDKKPNLVPKERVKEAVSTDIQESTRPMNEVLPDPEDKDAMDKKPAPKEYDGQAEGNDESIQGLAQPQEDEKPGSLKYNNHEQVEPQPDMPIENATSDVAEQTEQQDMISDKHCPSCTCEEHSQSMDDGQSIEDILDQHLENSKDFNSTIENDAQDDNKEPNDTEELLDQHIENASELEHRMENGTSRPENYDQENQDLGLSEEDAGDPNLSQVLQGGLDQHADSIHKEKVMQMVGQALDGFKSQKAILDKAKEQAPELHDACINMLKAMIELCSLAGIDESRNEQDVKEIEGQGSHNPDEACPTCGKPQEDQMAAPQEQQSAPQEQQSAPEQTGNKPMASNKPQNDSNPVGQSVKKLPTKHGTPHVAKEPIPEGGINTKGQKKVTDKEGSVRFIDMKQGRVKGPSGVPVKG